MTLPNKLLLSSSAFNQNLHENYKWMRQNQPVYEARFSRFKTAWLITRYDDVSALLRDPRLKKDIKNAQDKSGRSTTMWTPKAFRPLLHNMLNSDEPDHRRLRNLVHKAFTPRRIAELEPRIKAIADELLDKAIAKEKAGGSIDLITEYALPLPLTVIAEMIGIPESDRERFHKIATGVLVTPTPLNMLKAVPAIRRLVIYLRELAEIRRADPKDDLISALAQAEHEGDSFTEDELIGMLFILLVAGHETTVNLIGSGTLALLRNPEQLDLLREDRSLIGSAVEEMVRYEGPLQTTEMAFAGEDITLHGVTIPKGKMILPALISANRDETVFENADTFDITRSPNKHLAYGQGIHYCLGAPLARMEGHIAFNTLLDRAPDLRLGVNSAEIKYDNMVILRRLPNLPVKLT